MLVLATTFDGTKTRARKCRENKRPGNGVPLPGLTKERSLSWLLLLLLILLLG